MFCLELPSLLRMNHLGKQAVAAVVDSHKVRSTGRGKVFAAVVVHSIAHMPDEVVAAVGMEAAILVVVGHVVPFDLASFVVAAAEQDPHE